MEIRSAVLADVPEMFHCSVKAFKDYILLIDRTPGPMLEDYYEGVKEHHAFIVPDKDSLAGFVLIKDGDADFMWLDVLAVQPEQKGAGIGKALVRFSEEFICSQGHKECRLYTHVQYKHAINMYRHLGYQEYQRVQEDGYDRFYFRKLL